LEERINLENIGRTFVKIRMKGFEKNSPIAIDSVYTAFYIYSTFDGIMAIPFGRK